MIDPNDKSNMIVATWVVALILAVVLTIWGMVVANRYLQFEHVHDHTHPPHEHAHEHEPHEHPHPLPPHQHPHTHDILEAKPE